MFKVLIVFFIDEGFNEGFKGLIFIFVYKMFVGCVEEIQGYIFVVDKFLIAIQDREVETQRNERVMVPS